MTRLYANAALMVNECENAQFTEMKGTHQIKLC
jgi:hypothetical protein